MISRRKALAAGLSVSITTLSGCGNLLGGGRDIAMYRVADVSEDEQQHALGYLERVRDDIDVAFTVDVKTEPITPSGTEMDERTKSFNRKLETPTPGRYSNVLLDTLTGDRQGYAECASCGDPDCQPSGAGSDVTVVGGFGTERTPPWTRHVLAAHRDARNRTELERYAPYVAFIHELGHNVACASHEFGTAWRGSDTPEKYDPDGSSVSVYASPMASSHMATLGGTANQFGTPVPDYYSGPYQRLYHTTLLSPAVARQFEQALA